MLKRSQINQAIDEASEFFRQCGISLPPFSSWSEKDFRKHLGRIEGILKGKLGWDVTDFGQADFSGYGRIIFTLRNGYSTQNGLSKPYAQKLMYFKENQKSPIHYHKSKTEDIINMAGGVIIVRLWSKTSAGGLSSEPVTAEMDGRLFKVQPGEEINLNRGESLCVPHDIFHQFLAGKGKGSVISMEVSSVNDDMNDNFWLESRSRYPEIEEDESRKRVLCYEYNSLFGN